MGTIMCTGKHITRSPVLGPLLSVPCFLAHGTPLKAARRLAVHHVVSPGTRSSRVVSHTAISTIHHPCHNAPCRCAPYWNVLPRGMLQRKPEHDRNATGGDSLTFRNGYCSCISPSASYRANSRRSSHTEHADSSGSAGKPHCGQSPRRRFERRSAFSAAVHSGWRA